MNRYAAPCGIATDGVENGDAAISKHEVAARVRFSCRGPQSFQSGAPVVTRQVYEQRRLAALTEWRRHCGLIEVRACVGMSTTPRRLRPDPRSVHSLGKLRKYGHGLPNSVIV